MEHPLSCPRKKSWKRFLLVASAILSSFFQVSLAPDASTVDTDTQLLTSNHNVTSFLHGTTQSIQSYGPSSVEISPSGNITRLLGSHLSLNCSAKFTPVLYSWSFNDTNMNETSNCLTINLTSWEKEGTYKCYAYSPETNTKVWASVYVRITTDQESLSDHLEQLLKVIGAITAGLVVAVVTVIGVLLYCFCTYGRHDNPPLTVSTPSVYDDIPPPMQTASGTKPETPTDSSTTYEALQHGEESLYEELQN